MRLPDFFIAGEMKCGSTTLWDMLASDGRIFSSHDKELHFFASYTYFGGSGPDALGDLDAYAAHFAGAKPDQLCGEATPNYLFDLKAPERIRRVVPEARLIIILRDPVDRAWSHYWHQVRRGWDKLSFEKALEAEPGRIETGDLQQRDAFSYLARGRYIESLERLEAQFPRERILILTLEELKTDPLRELDRVSVHLGLSPPIEAPGPPPHRNKADFPRFPALDRLIQRAKPAAAAAGPLIEGLAAAAAKATRPVRRRSGSGLMKPATRDALRDVFARSDADLADRLGRPVPWRRMDAKDPERSTTDDLDRSGDLQSKASA